MEQQPITDQQTPSNQPAARASLFTFYQRLIRQNSEWIKRVSLWFVVAIIAGAFVYAIGPRQIEQILAVYGDLIGENFEPGLGLAAKIFIQNLMATMIALFGGILFGIIPLFVVLVNGFLIGYVLTFVVASSNNILEGIAFVLVAIVPHGIFEIPAFLLAAALGLRVGLNFIKRENKGKRARVLKQDLLHIFYLLPVIIVLLVVAALVEGIITATLVT